MLENVYYGNSLRDWGISLLIIVGALILNRVIRLLNQRVVQRIAVKNKTRYADVFFQAIEKPVMLGVLLIAIWFASNRLAMSESLQGMIAKSYRVLIILNSTWFMARIAVAFFEEYNDSKKTHKGIENRLSPIIKRGILFIIWVFGIVTALNHIGIEVTTLLGTLGIGGIAFALAAQDTIKNIFGGITILVDQTFSIGDTIRFDTIEGTVEDIGLRSTRIRTHDKWLVTIPNYKITDAQVINITKRPACRVLTTLGLTYDTTYEEMQQALELLKKIPETVSDVHHKDLAATFSEFGDSALVITFIYFIRKSANIRETTSKVNFEILRTFNAAGLNFAFPSQTVYLENNAGKVHV
ncbi:MAG: mechanosensitive ion channel family protein [Tannerella sp.]|jgi:MscS family membrane protein|nr:mechanosensitive ion channel family protein [Tannerella sp.]